MGTISRIILTFVCGVATFYFVFWVGGAILSQLGVAASIAPLLAFILALLIGRFVWVQTGNGSSGLGRAVGLGAATVGGIGFALGFFGPIILSSGANQGPLLGIFITGPLGAFIGALGGCVYWIIKRS